MQAGRLRGAVSVDSAVVPAALIRRTKRLSAQLKTPVALFRCRQGSLPAIAFTVERLAKWLGAGRRELLADPGLFWNRLAEPGRAQLVEALAAVHDSAADSAVQLRLCLQPAGRSERQIEISLVREYRATDGAMLYSGVFVDVSARDATQQSLLADAMRLRTFVENSRDGIVVLNRTMRAVEANPAFAQMLGYSQDELRGMHVWDWDRSVGQEALEALGRSEEFGLIREVETVHTRKDGTRLPVEIVSDLCSWDGVDYAFCVVRDISARKRAEAELQQREREFRTLVEHSPDIIIRYDRDFRRVYANPAARQLPGLIVGTCVEPAIRNGGPLLRPELLLDALKKVFREGCAMSTELNFIHPDGEIGSAFTRFEPEVDEHGRIASVLAIGRDVTSIVRQREEVHRLAFYDALTGLPNRVQMNRRIQDAHNGALQRRGGFVLMLLDLDGFKDVNDTLGHHAGDELLRETARRLRVFVGAEGTLARMGGDEFAILLPAPGGQCDAGAVAEAMLNALARRYWLNGQEVFISGSIGIARFPSDSTDIDELYAYADAAMYGAKNRGRNNYQYFQPSLVRDASERLALSGALRLAIERQEFEVFYQPKVRLPGGEIIGAEALLRWRHPERGLLGPDSFIPVAEETGMIVEIGDWVLRQASATVARWNRGRAQPITMAVNLSIRQFHKHDLVSGVREALVAAGCRSDWLELEITETLLLEDAPHIRQTLSQLSQMGISIAIDDFGTGHAALAYLSQFEADTLKIDRTLVRGALRDHRTCVVTKGVVSIAHALNMRLVAEGVDSEAQVAFLVRQGCGAAQGFLFGAPMPEAEFGERLRGQQRASTGAEAVEAAPLAKVQPIRPKLASTAVSVGTR